MLFHRATALDAQNRLITFKPENVQGMYEFHHGHRQASQAASGVLIYSLHYATT
jgi:hypothetical protein